MCSYRSSFKGTSLQTSCYLQIVKSPRNILDVFLFVLNQRDANQFCQICTLWEIGLRDVKEDSKKVRQIMVDKGHREETNTSISKVAVSISTTQMQSV